MLPNWKQLTKKKARFTDPVAKDDMLDWRMTLVSLNSCIACLVVLSLRASLLCSAANRVVQKLLDGNTKTQGMMKIAHKMEDCRFSYITVKVQA
jgi:hypothetical protein